MSRTLSLVAFNLFFYCPSVLTSTVDSAVDDGFEFPEDKTNVDGDTPLHHAAENGHLEVVRCLLAAGAEKDKDSGWYFPFLWLPSLV